MKKTLQTLDLICTLLSREAGAKCSTKHVHGDLFGSAAVAIVPVEFPDGTRYLVQLTKLSPPPSTTPTDSG